MTAFVGSPYGQRDGSARADEKGTWFKAMAAPATVSGEPNAKLPLGQPGKAAVGAEPRARRPAITGVNAATSVGVLRWVHSTAAERAGLTVTCDVTCEKPS